VIEERINRIRGAENSKSTRVTDAKGAKLKQWLHDFLSHPWVVSGLQGGCRDGADGRAECGKPRTSWGSSRYRYRKSATAVRRVTLTDVPTVLPSSIFDFVPGTSPSWSSTQKYVRYTAGLFRTVD
jgi:hypothetical protein